MSSRTSSEEGKSFTWDDTWSEDARHQPAVRVRIFRVVLGEFSDAIRHDDKDFVKMMRGHIRRR